VVEISVRSAVPPDPGTAYQHGRLFGQLLEALSELAESELFAPLGIEVTTSVRLAHVQAAVSGEAGPGAGSCEL
jgi:hypothetical protein